MAILFRPRHRPRHPSEPPVQPAPPGQLARPGGRLCPQVRAGAAAGAGRRGARAVETGPPASRLPGPA